MSALTFDPGKFREIHQRKTLEEDQKAFSIAVNVLTSWQFTDSEKAVVLGDISIATFRRMKAGKMPTKLSTDRRTRLSLVLGIHKELRTLFLQEEHRREWLINPNRAFAEFSPKDIMLCGSLSGLNDIRRYLSSQSA